ncbi:MAG: helix-turn-helix domain-containing protein, partial [Rhodobiaceae bacterium]
CLTQDPGRIVSRTELADGEDISERAIDVQINRLRRKIESDPRDPIYLQTVRGAGYVLRTD